MLPCLPLSTPEWVQLEEELFELLLKFSHLQRNEGTLMFMTGLYKSACMSLSHIMMPYKPARILAPTHLLCAHVTHRLQPINQLQSLNLRM